MARIKDADYSDLQEIMLRFLVKLSEEVKRTGGHYDDRFIQKVIEFVEDYPDERIRRTSRPPSQTRLDVYQRLVDARVTPIRPKS